MKIRHGAYATAAVLAEAETDPALRHALDVAAARAARAYKGVASHHSAAQMHGLHLLRKPPASTVTLTTPPSGRTGRYRHGQVVSHAAELPAEHLTKLFGMPATTAARTVIDIARSSPFLEGVVVADSALHARYASKADLRRVLAYCERWPGISRARQVADFASPLAESVLESCARVFFRDQGLPPAELQARIIGVDGRFAGRVDFCWRDLRTIAEADGLGKYETGEKAIAELRRDRLLREAGYEVVHFTWQELFAGPARVASRVREAFSRAIRLGG